MSRKLAYPVWMLAFVAAALVSRDAAWCAAGGAIGLGAQFVAARAWRAPSGVALANVLTLLRLAIVVALPLLLAWLPRAGFVALVVALLVLDGVDGYVARARGEASPFGAAFDMETDALTVMVLTILLWQSEIGPWVLVAGLWRYAYAVAVAIVPALGDCPPSPIYRWLFTCLMIALAGAFVPWHSAARAFAAIGTVLVSFSFLHSIARSRRFRATGSAPP